MRNQRWCASQPDGIMVSMRELGALKTLAAESSMALQMAVDTAKPHARAAWKQAREDAEILWRKAIEHAQAGALVTAREDLEEAARVISACGGITEYESKALEMLDALG